MPPPGRSRPPREVMATLEMSQPPRDVMAPQVDHSCSQRSQPPQGGHSCPQSSQLPPERSWLPREVTAAPRGHGHPGRSQLPPEVMAPEGGHSRPQACELTSSRKGSQADSGLWPTARVGFPLLGLLSVLWQPAQGAQWGHRLARADSGQRCSQGDQLHCQLLQVTGHTQDLFPSLRGLGEGGGPSGAEGRGQLDPGPDAGTARAQGWGSGQSIQVRWTLPSAQPSPGGKGPESLQTRSGVDTAPRTGWSQGRVGRSSPSVAWGPPAGLTQPWCTPLPRGPRWEPNAAL